MPEPEVLKVLPAEMGVPAIVLYKNNTWVELTDQARSEPHNELPPRFARVHAVELSQYIAGKKYCELNVAERRIYNRLRKRKSDAKLATAPTVQEQRKASRKVSMRAFY